ncbi:MAG: 16S rRNA (cytidine(1402)-2'-O)-methyltransferase [Acidimicrobiia bacterium]|nr:16S rRNA (cytidine(1402)-2'-O)-methyltransferase [Acidimicrobiia bacterium]
MTADVTGEGSATTEPRPVEPGTFYIVGTPIGNLGDLSLRAAVTLAAVDAVVCEDTRRTGGLLAHIRTNLAVRSAANPDSELDTRRPDLLVANEHTEYSRTPEVLDRLGRGEALALVTDAGMPTVSDPGASVIAAVIEAGHRVVVVPGPTAVSSALALSGLPAERFVFEGFLPRKGADRRDRLTALAGESRTIVVFEAPHRLLRTLRDLAAACGADRRVSVARELTKLYEEVDRTTLAEAARRFATEQPRGEFVLVLEGAPAPSGVLSDTELTELIDRHLAAGDTTRDTVSAVVAATGQPKRRIYDLAVSRAGRAGETR